MSNYKICQGARGVKIPYYGAFEKTKNSGRMENYWKKKIIRNSLLILLQCLSKLKVIKDTLTSR